MVFKIGGSVSRGYSNQDATIATTVVAHCQAGFCWRDIDAGFDSRLQEEYDFL
jgi:hypothetical protein